MSEQTFHSDNRVTVTSARVVMDNITYPVAGITTVSEWHQKRKTWMVLVSVLMALSAACVAIVGNGEVSGHKQGPSGVVYWSLIFAAIAAAGYLTSGPFYIVRIGTSGSDKDGIKSRDRAYVRQVVQAINNAIVARG